MHYFSFLGASETHFASLAAFVVAVGRFLGVLARSWGDFGTLWARFSKFLEVPKPHSTMFFSRFLVLAPIC